MKQIKQMQDRLTENGVDFNFDSEDEELDYGVDDEDEEDDP